EATGLTCQACHRINDMYPAGIVQLKGAELAKLRDQILQLARHQEQAERGQHPLNRILDVQEDGETLTIRTTDIHLPRRIGEAGQNAYKGALTTDYDEGRYFVRVSWTSRD